LYQQTKDKHGVKLSKNMRISSLQVVRMYWAHKTKHLRYGSVVTVDPQSL